ncbi:hypothetical protein [Streptomyces luteogriseus]|uniref:hypothetical protein n=1 Tax=Streptomyces luteogriseus TaxID=68233 RepID=UPI003FA3981B
MSQIRLTCPAAPAYPDSPGWSEQEQKDVAALREREWPHAVPREKKTADPHDDILGPVVTGRRRARGAGRTGRSPSGTGSTRISRRC